MWTCTQNTESRSGFSLLEVLLAVMVLGLALTVFFSAASQGLQFTVQAREYKLQREWLYALEHREPLDLENLEAGTFTGTFSYEDLTEVQWERVIEHVGEEEDAFYTLRTRVWREGRGAESGESVETFLYQPSAVSGNWVREPYED